METCFQTIFLRDYMGFDIALSNPYTTKPIAKSRKKADVRIMEERTYTDLSAFNTKPV